MINIPKKPSTKADLVNELKSMKKLYEDLEEENRKNLDKITIMEKKIEHYEKSNTKYLNEKVDGHCQTAPEGLFFCYECEYPSGDYYELGEHMIEYHSNSLYFFDFFLHSK